MIENTIETDYYFVNELFVTIQGEASFAGTPSIFIRLQSCDVGCPWCDTKYTWSLDAKNITTDINEILNKHSNSSSNKNIQNNVSNININDDLKQENVTTNNKYIRLATDELIRVIMQHEQFKHIKHVVITGGEPALYNLTPLCNQLHKLNKTVQIETSGTAILKVSKETWVTLSPKINMPSKKIVLPENIKRANEIKMPIGKIQDINLLKQFLHDNQQCIQATIPIWLQALSQNKKATELCIMHSIQNNWKLSIQIHKYINIA